MKNKHDIYLDYLIRNLDQVDEKYNKAEWIMVEGLWLDKGSCKKFCDIIIAYPDYGVPLELKSRHYRGDYANLQLEQGKEFIESKLSLPCDYGKIVYYGKPKFKYNTLRWNE